MTPPVTTPVGGPSAAANRRANHLTAAPTQGLSWRPLQRSTRAAVSAALVAAVFYVVFLLNPDYRGDTWLWILVLMAELLTVLHALGTWWTILANDNAPDRPEVYAMRRRLLSGELRPTIDVFITACGEPIEIILGTVYAARDMRIDHRTWVLDDGRSDALREACEAVGVGYLRREGREHAKAGNINAALARTNGAFVVILDADHVPSPDFLARALPHMYDDDVAFVQTPQAFPSSHGLVAVGSAEAQRIFYELVCPGKNHFNAVFCVGTNVIFRRSALEDLGGIYTQSNSEDIWTSLEMHRRGWRSVFVPETLARGLAPDNLHAYFKQQFRWAYGGFEVLLRGGLLRRGGLTLDQRLQYLMTGSNYLLSLSVLVFMFLPPAYLLFGYSPIRVETGTWLMHYVPFYVLIVLVTWLQCGGFKPAAIVSSIGAAPVQARALLMVLLRRKASWSVTNAAGSMPGVELVLPHIALLLLNATSIVVGLATIRDLPATILSVVWALLQMAILGRVVAEAVLAPRRQQQRLEHRKMGARIARARPWPVRVDEPAEITG
jgi:cellulose synthase (UDP-forming)